MAPLTAACQVSLSFIVSQSLLKFMSIETVMPSNHLILCRLLLLLLLLRLLLLLPSIFPSIRVSSNELAFHIRRPKYWSFNISPSNEYSWLISFRIDWLDLLVVQRTQESSAAPKLESIIYSALILLYSPTLTSIHDYWKNHSFDYRRFCRQSDVSTF